MFNANLCYDFMVWTMRLWICWVLLSSLIYNFEFQVVVHVQNLNNWLKILFVHLYLKHLIVLEKQFEIYEYQEDSEEQAIKS